MTSRFDEEQRTASTMPLAYRYYLGLTTRDGIALSREGCIEQVAGFLQQLGISGLCAMNAQGWYAGEHEESLVIFVSGIGQVQHVDFLSWMCSTFNQECVAYEQAERLEFFYKESTQLCASSPSEP